MGDVTFIIPAYNEENSIGRLLDDIKKLYPHYPVFVINNNSNDKTPLIAEKSGVNVIHEKKQGKGNAIKKGFTCVKSDYIVMLDADNTYDPSEALDLLEPLFKNSADVVLGCRLNGKKEKGSITRFNLVGNHILSLTASILFSRISDVCTGYWAFKKEVVDDLLERNLVSNGFEVEAEMFAKVSQGNFKVKERAISYRRRADSPKLNSLKDGWKIFLTLWIHKIRNN
jgi:glycosyltransferase involved in cell wall biosynthesis